MPLSEQFLLHFTLIDDITGYVNGLHSSIRGLVNRLGVRKTLWFDEDEAETLRERAYKMRRSEASLIREAVRRFLGIED